MSTITITVDLPDVDNPLLLERAAAEIEEKIENLDLTINGTTSVNHHTVASVKHSAPARKASKKK